jgi:hypothetical protein
MKKCGKYRAWNGCSDFVAASFALAVVDAFSSASVG